MPDTIPSATADASGRENTAKRQRLLDEALRLFSKRGFAAVTVRELAAAAGVSIGLIRIHFGSKDGLRQELDAHVLREIRSFYAGVISYGGIEGVIYMAEDLVDLIERDRDVLMYLRMSLLENTPGSQIMINEIMDIMRSFLKSCADKGTLKDGIDVEQAALFLAFDLLGPIILEPFALNAIGTSMYNRDAIAKRNDFLRRLLTGGMLTT